MLLCLFLLTMVKAVLLLAFLGCSTLAIPLGQMDPYFRSQTYPGIQQDQFALNPWMARKYQNQWTQEAPSTMTEPFQQLRQMELQLHYIQQKLQQQKHMYNMAQWQQYMQDVNRYLNQVYNLQEQYQRGQQFFPESEMTQLQLQIQNFYQEIQGTPQDIGYPPYPQKSFPTSRFQSFQKSYKWNPLNQQRLTPMSGIGQKESFKTYNKQMGYPYQKGSMSTGQPKFIRQRQQEAGLLPNQWDEDYTEQGTFQDLVRHYFAPPQNQELQSQRQMAHYESQGVDVNPRTAEVIIENPELLKRQQQVLYLLKNLHQPYVFGPEVGPVEEDYSIEANIDNYNDIHAVHNLMKQCKRGLLPKGAIFSIFNPEHVRQVVTLFKVLYHAKDWDTFIRTGTWAKINLNEDLFHYVFTIALVQRGDTDFLALPPAYFVNPHYFINQYVIQKAQNIKQSVSEFTPQTKYLINSNYSGWYLNLDPEQSLSYFLEDIGLNDYYYDYHLNYPFWMNTEYLKFGGDRRGEQIYYFIQQLLARYYMERLSNNMGDIPEFDLDDDIIDTGYVPSLRYPNGVEFPTRASNVHLGRKELVDEAELIVERIKDAIDAGYVIDEEGNRIELVGEDGFEILLNIIDSTPESPNPQYYGPLHMIMRWVLGHSLEPFDSQKLVPSALEHYETTLRDPVSWQMFKKFVELVQYYKRHLPSYNQQQLHFPGVSVEEVRLDPLITFFDQYDVDISNAVYVNEREYVEDSVKIFVRQARLNNKPFTVQMTVTSQQAQPAVVRIFLGPKHDEYEREIDINENRLNFFELDKFQVDLQQGLNKIVRESLQMNVAEDWSFEEGFNQQVREAVEQQGSLHVQYSDLLTAFPRRLLLPKGQWGGQTFQIFVMVTPLIDSPQQHQAIEQMQQNVFGKDYNVQKGILNQYVDGLPLGYPFDREIDETVFFDIPNAVFQDVVIEHQGPEILEAQRLIIGDYQRDPNKYVTHKLF